MKYLTKIPIFPTINQSLHLTECDQIGKSMKMSRSITIIEEQPKIGCLNKSSSCVIHCNNNHYCQNNTDNGTSNGNHNNTSGSMNNFTATNGSHMTKNNNHTNHNNNNIPETVTTNSKIINNHTSSHWMAYIFIGSVAIACYINGIHGDFVHDDIPAIILNKDVIGTNRITKSFFNDFWGTPMDDANSHKSYRPLTTITFRLNYYLFGLKAVWFHLTNVLMHAIVCILFTRVCIIVAGLKDNFAIIAGIIFAVHPIHTEAVTGIVGRADILACIFFLISLLIYHGNLFRSDSTSTWLSIVFGGISMLSKETGITVFLVNLTYDLYRTWPSLKRVLVDVHWTPESQHCYRRLLKLLISMGILLIIRLALLQGSFPKFSQQDNPTAYHPCFHVRMLTFCYLAAFNWWLLLCPATLSHDWQMGSIPLLTTFSDPRNLLTMWAFVSTILMLHKSILDFENQRYAPLILGVLLLFLPFLPATNLFVTVGFVVAERVLYIPSLGCILLVVYGAQIVWETMSKYRSFIILMGILLITVGTCKTMTRNRDWYSREYLLRAGLRVLPHNAKMHYNFGNFLKDSFQHDMARIHYREALRLWPTYASAHNNLGTLVNNFEVAEQHFLSAILYASTHVNAHFNLAQLYIKRNRTTEAAEMLTHCTKLDGTHIKAHIELFKLNRGVKAALILRNAIRLNPHRTDLRIFFGQWLLKNGFTPAASNIFRWVLHQDKTNVVAIAGICRCLRQMGQWSRLNLFITRLQTIYRIAHGGRSYNIDIYLRSWNIRTEIRRRAYLYDIENDTFHQPDIVQPSSNTESHLESVIITPKPEHQHFSSYATSQENAAPKQHIRKKIRPIATIRRNDFDQLLYHKSDQKKMKRETKYKKQYCYTFSKAMLPTFVDIIFVSEINQTLPKTIKAVETGVMQNVCNQNLLSPCCCRGSSILTKTKCIRCCSKNQIIQFDEQPAKTTILCPRKRRKSKKIICIPSKSTVNTSYIKNENENKLKQTSENKPPNHKTVNSFKSRLLFNDMIDANLKGID